MNTFGKQYNWTDVEAQVLCMYSAEIYNTSTAIAKKSNVHFLTQKDDVFYDTTATIVVKDSNASKRRKRCHSGSSQ